MQTSEFESALANLVGVVDRGPLVIMCAEAVPWRCHRSLIAALLVRSFEVEHFLSPTRYRKHTLTPFAQVEVTKITYPGRETAERESQQAKCA